MEGAKVYGAWWRDQDEGNRVEGAKWRDKVTDGL